MSWVYLSLGILLEVAGTVCLKLSHGFARAGLSVLTIVLYGASILAMAATMKHMPASLAYAVWSAVGTAAVAAIGILWFKEPVTAGTMMSLGMIIAGVVGLNLLR